MSNAVLLSPTEACDALARCCCNTSLTRPLTLSVQEDALFAAADGGSKWLQLGQVRLRTIALKEGDASWQDVRAAMRQGAYEWQLPTFSEIENRLLDCVHSKSPKDTDPDKPASGGKKPRPEDLLDQARRTAEAFLQLLLRTGLEHPRLDPSDFGLLPFRRPVTLVADTNSVLQGGLDFAARFLYPMARLRVPGAVHIELNSLAHRYIKTRRAHGNEPLKKLKALLERLHSQGGLRTLLRLELQAGVEIERLRVDHEHFEDSRLDANRASEQATMPDRVILESAMRHRNRVSFGHDVRIMTSDHAPAKSTLIEGVAPFYFPVREWTELGGRTYRGVLFSPFRSLGTSAFHRVGFIDLLWELATGFGAVRVAHNGDWSFTVRAIGEQLPWSVYQARHELLWIEQETRQSTKPLEKTVVEDDPNPNSIDFSQAERSTVAESAPAEPVEGSSQRKPISTTFNLPTLLKLFSRLHQHRSASMSKLATQLNLSVKTLSDYGYLLETGGFAKRRGDKITTVGEFFDPLWTAIQNRDWSALNRLCMRFPGYKAFSGQIAQRKPTQPEQITALRVKVVPTYLSLAEACGAALRIPNEGIYACGDASGGVRGFVGAAISSYKTVCDESGLAQTGAWLEMLAREHAIHPLFVPQLFQEATADGLLKVTLEGAQPDVRQPEHAFSRIVVGVGGRLSLETVYLYRGDYLAPHRSSVDLRIDTSKQ